MTSKKLEEKASILSNEPYGIEYAVDETVDGHTVFLLTHPELPGCMAQGVTIEDALKELQEVRYDCLLSLLEDGLPIPSPIITTTETLGISQNLSVEDRSIAIQSLGRQQIATVSVVC